MSQEIIRIATSLRAVLDEYINAHPEMRQSSCGFCIIASKALDQILRDAGHPSSQVRGRFDGPDNGHAWVVTNGMIIDITQDQYEGGERVFVGDAADRRYAPVTDDDQFLKDMGPAGDDGDWWVEDIDGNERLLGTTNSIAQEVIAMYNSKFSTRE